MGTKIMLGAIGYANMAIGRDLKNMREEFGFPQAEVARKARIRPEMLCRIEAGHGNPTVATITRIVKAIEQLSGQHLLR